MLVDLDAADEKPVVFTGVVVRGPGGLERLQRLNHFLAGGPFHDLGWSEWAAIGPGGAVARALSGQGFAAPLPVRQEDGPVQHHTHLDLSLTSAIGPYLSMQRQIYEFRENGFFDRPFHGGFEARRLETGKHVTWPAALLAEAARILGPWAAAPRFSGGRVSYSGIDPPALGPRMRARMHQVFPQLKDVDIDYVWGGYVDISMSRAPHWGRIGPNLYFAQGFSGHGIAATGLAGRVIAEAIHGQSSRLDVFARIPHRKFPGGRALRTPALVLAMLWFRMKDWL